MRLLNQSIQVFTAYHGGEATATASGIRAIAEEFDTEPLTITGAIVPLTPSAQSNISDAQGLSLTRGYQLFTQYVNSPTVLIVGSKILSGGREFRIKAPTTNHVGSGLNPSHYSVILEEVQFSNA